jgi:hypothetical protein
MTLRDSLSEALAHGGNTLAVGATLRTRSESGQEQDMVVAASDNEGVVLRPSGRRRGDGHARLHRADGGGRRCGFPLIGFAAPAEGLTIGTLHERSVFVRSATAQPPCRPCALCAGGQQQRHAGHPWPG